jgi:Fic family protein
MREAENSVRQARRLTLLIQGALARPEVSPLSLAVVCELNRRAVEGLMPTAGTLRDRSDVEIFGSRHVLPPHESVLRLCDEACSFVAARWSDDALFLAAYVLWRLSWIHPFEDGNGRTARAASYL